MRLIARTGQIVGIVGGYLAWWAGVHVGLVRPALSPPERLSRDLDRLGTTFRKLGQMLSLRRDLLPDEYVGALQHLQDRAEPFGADAACQEIERHLGQSVEQLFAEFYPIPLAAASIAQGYGARMRDGQWVIVKVRRPTVTDQVRRDMRILRILVRLMVALIPPMRRVEPIRVVREIEANLRRELDFRQEARNIRRFMAMFQDSQTVYIPAVIDNLIAEAVLVQELSPGTRIDDAALPLQGPRLAAILVDAYMTQFFAYGVFHGDPHPGNLFVLPDGRLCLHDFGLTGRLDAHHQRNLAALMQAFVYQDANWLLDAFLGLGMLAGKLDRAEFKRGLQDLLDDYSSLPLKDWSFAEAFMRMARLGQGQNIRMPHELLVLMRTMVLVEADVRILDPGFNLLDGMMVRAREIVKPTWRWGEPSAFWARLGAEAGRLAQDLPPALLWWIYHARVEGMGGAFQRGLGEFESHLDCSSNRVSLAMVTLGLYIASALLMRHSLGPRVGDLPLLALAGFGMALWFTWRLTSGISRSGRL